MDRQTGGQEPDEDGHDVRALACTIVLRRLAMAPRTRQELAQRLAERGIPEHVSQEVLDRFTELGYVDDVAFAQGWVESRHRSKALARSVIRGELRRRGIEDEVAHEALLQISPEQEAVRATAYAKRRAERLAGVDREVALRRISSALMRRGFHWSVALSAAQEALDGASEYGVGHNKGS